jgi:hypothetical protein
MITKKIKFQSIKKTIVKISNDYGFSFAHESKVEDINYLANEINVFCEIKNHNYTNIVEREKRYHSEKEDYKNKVIINAKGYSQSDWQDYVLYYNEEEITTPQDKACFNALVIHLKRTFTHQNDYIAESFDQIEIDGKIFKSDPYNRDHFCIDHIEFPSDEEISNEFTSIYGDDYYKCIVRTNN